MVIISENITGGHWHLFWYKYWEVIGEHEKK